MSTAILAALRTQTQLHGNTFLIATELAHRMNGSGYGRVSYQFLAWKAHCCRQTAITQIARLLELGLIRKTVIRTQAGYAWNHYQYIGPRAHTASPPVTTHGQKIGAILPDPEREKERSLRQEIAALQKGMRWWTAGSDQYAVCLEKMRQLEALLPTP